MRIYVGNLGYDVNDDALRAAFEPHGTVESATVITDKVTGQSRGFGFVEMPDDKEAQSAIDNLNGTELGGREIKVNQARPREDRGGGRGGGGRGGGRGGGGRGGGGRGGGGRGGGGRGRR